MVTTPMAQYGRRLIDNGFHIVPIMPGAKKPGKLDGSGWHGLSGWSEYCWRPVTEDELARWEQWPGCGIGIACGNVIGLDIDILDAGKSIAVQTLAFEMLGQTPAVRIGLAPKCLLVYRTATPFSGRKKHPIEILALGNQFVSHHIHPDTGQPYRWIDENLVDIPLDDLPGVAEEAVGRFLEAAQQITGGDQSNPYTNYSSFGFQYDDKPLPKGDEHWRAITNNSIGKGERNNTVASLTGHLLARHIDTRVTLALMQAFNATNCVPPLGCREVEKTVRSIAAREIKKRNGTNESQ